MNLEIDNEFEVIITSQNNDGLGVCKVNDVVVFVDNAITGDEGLIKITALKKNYALAKWISIKKQSPDRLVPPCPYFYKCGGCDLQHQTYDSQLTYKEHKVLSALERIGGFKHVEIDNIIADEAFNYRNKITLRVKEGNVGLYKRHTNDIVDIDKCIICNSKINDAIKVIKAFIKLYPSHTFEDIMIRTSDYLMININSKDNLLNDKIVSYLTLNLHDLRSIIINNKVLYGNDFIETNIDNFKFKLSTSSFFQINEVIMEKLYAKIIDCLRDTDNDTIIDLYCGIGTITLLLSKIAKRVIGIEVVPEAIANMKENMTLNNVFNVIPILGKVEQELSKFEGEEKDTIVLDPPRSGVEPIVLDSILNINPRNIIYISCNPSTLARDLKVLCTSDYKIKTVTPFDMFPQTNHVETLVVMSRLMN